MTSRFPCSKRDEEEDNHLFVNSSSSSSISSANIDVGGRSYFASRGSKVKLLSSEEAIRLASSQSRRIQLSDSSTSIPSIATALRAGAHKPSQNRDEGQSSQLGLIPVRRQNQFTNVLSPRDKVLETLRRFKIVFEELDRNKAARESTTGTNKIHYLTRDTLVKQGWQVNAEKMIGSVPGIEVGDVFQYKSELSLIGLHFDIRGGIDYINSGDSTLATSIISSEGNGYMDRFSSDVMIYCGQGGNLTSKDHKVIKDQKLETGNLALVHSMWEGTPVRVIFGKKRLDDRGKRYVYDGLYLVQNYWEEIGPKGNIMFKFELSRVPGQPYKRRQKESKGKEVYKEADDMAN